MGSYRGVTRGMRRFVQSRGLRYGGPGKYDVGHRTPLSQTPPGARVQLKIQRAGPNQAEGPIIRVINALRRKLGLFVR